MEIRDDVIEECNKHGGVLHVYVDKASPQGNVYVKCPSIATAVAAVNSLHGRWFAGKFRCRLHLACRICDKNYELYIFITVVSSGMPVGNLRTMIATVAEQEKTN